MSDFFWGYATGVAVLAGVNIFTGVYNSPPTKTVVRKVPVATHAVPCTEAQAAKAVIHGGTGSFTIPGGQQVTVKAPNGWCLQ
jgi:hypothetical protein